MCAAGINDKATAYDYPDDIGEGITMCGIAGQISADPNKIAANYPAYCRMQKSLARRGPDQRGMYLHGHAALIHAWLAVVDLENGCQPMVLEQGGEKYILVYNGELYNTPELHA